MSFFYQPNLNSETETLFLSKEESLHISKTLRGKPGDLLKLIDGKGQIARAEILSIPKNKGEVECRLVNLQKTPEPKNKIHLYLAPPRHNILGPLLKQCTELGVWEIHLIECEYSVAKPKDKTEALFKDILAGAKQSGNTYFPVIHDLVPFKKAVSDCALPGFIGAVPEDQFGTSSYHDKDNIALWIGPEGGFSAKEKELLRLQNCSGICLGNWILRIETAVVGLLAVLNQR
jgi:16S rRNA (uracil1498-N3)-methyltransferase